MTEIAVLKKHIINYARTREVFAAYKASGYSKKYFAEHESDILLHRTAKKALNVPPKTEGKSRKNAMSFQIARPAAGIKKSPKMPENQAFSSLLRSGAGGGGRTRTGD